MEWLWLVLLLPILLASISLASGRKASDDRVRRLERKLDLIIEHLGIQVPEPDAPPGVMEALADPGRKIEAIKLYRQATGVGLKEAKDAVEALAKRYLGPV